MNKQKILGLVGLLGFACGTERLNAGSNADGGSPSKGSEVGTPWNGTPSNTFDLPCTLPAPSGLAGTWQGEFDSNVLPSGSRSIRLEIRGAYGASDGLCGTVTLGSGPPLPVATDGRAAPAGAKWPFDESHLREGFPFEFYASGKSASFFFDASPEQSRIVPPAVDGDRLRFGITLRQVYKSWCNLQLSYAKQVSTPTMATTPPNYSCEPPDAFSGGPGGVYCDQGPVLGITVDHVSCDQATYCLTDMCDCGSTELAALNATPDGCTVNPAGETRFDLTVAGDTLSGGIILGRSVETLHLTRTTTGGDAG